MVIQFFFFFYLLSVVMKQDTPDAVRSHNTVISEDSTNWIFFLLSVSGLAYNEQ